MLLAAKQGHTEVLQKIVETGLDIHEKNIVSIWTGLYPNRDRGSVYVYFYGVTFTFRKMLFVHHSISDTYVCFDKFTDH